MRRVLLLFVGVLALASVAVASGATQAESRWVITDLGTFGGEYSKALAINDRGQIVGWADTKREDADGDPIQHAFLWQNGKMRDLTPRGPASTATGINERGEVVGWSRTGESEEQAVLWRSGKMLKLGVSVPDSSPLAVNDRRQIVGTRADLHAFLWEKGQVRLLGGGKESEALAINERGQVVGQTFDAAARGPTLFHAFVWEKGRTLALGGLGGASTSAYAINERGQVVGQADLRVIDRESKWHDPICNAFLWQNGRMQNLGSASHYSVAYGINDLGQIVGRMTTLGENGEDIAVLWRYGKMTTLDGMSEAVAINERGQIVGNSGWHAVLWTLKR